MRKPGGRVSSPKEMLILTEYAHMIDMASLEQFQMEGNRTLSQNR